MKSASREKLDDDHLIANPMASVNAKMMSTTFKWDPSKTANDNLRMLEIIVKLCRRMGEHKSTNEALTILAFYSGIPKSLFGKEIKYLMDALSRMESWNDNGEPQKYEGNPAPTIDWLRAKLERVETQDRFEKRSTGPTVNPSTTTQAPASQHGTAYHAQSYPPTYGITYLDLRAPCGQATAWRRWRWSNERS